MLTVKQRYEIRPWTICPTSINHTATLGDLTNTDGAAFPFGSDLIFTGETWADRSDARYGSIQTGTETTIRVPPGAILVGKAGVGLAAWSWGRL